MEERARQETPRHPMGVVVQRTGLTAHVLRAWERRYGAVEPGRTKGGQRLYSDADIVRLRLLRRATEAGRAIGTVAVLPTEELAVLVGEDVGDAGARRDGRGGHEAYLEACLAAADRLDGSGLRAELMRAVVRLSPSEFVERVAGPLLHRVGELWEEGSMRPSQEHVVSTAVRQVLDWMLSRFDPGPEAPLLVAGTPSGELHEFGAMLAAVVAADVGWRVLYLGPSLPAGEIANAATRTGASAVAISVVDGEEIDRQRSAAELRKLRTMLPEGLLLVVGGRRASDMGADGATRVADLEAFREVLAAAGPSGEGSAR